MKNTKFYIDPLDIYLDSLPAWVHYVMGVFAFGIVYAIIFMVFSL